MKRRLFCLLIVLALSVQAVSAKVLKWVDFSVPYQSLKYAMDVDIKTSEEEKHISWLGSKPIRHC